MASPTAADVAAAFAAWEADRSASLDLAKTVYQSDWGTFNDGWNQWRAAAGDEVVDEARDITATFNA